MKGLQDTYCARVKECSFAPFTSCCSLITLHLPVSAQTSLLSCGPLSGPAPTDVPSLPLSLTLAATLNSVVFVNRRWNEATEDNAAVILKGQEKH